MPKRPTLTDIAARAGVGVATVDRVLNGRAVVREETGRRVLEAAEALGYHATALFRRRLDATRPQYRLSFLLQRPEQPFYQAFSAELAAACAASPAVRAGSAVEFLPSQAPADIVAALRAAAARSQAIAMVAIDHPAVMAAVAELAAAGIPVFALLSDFAPGVRRGYLGLNNRKAGRTAGWLLARSIRGPGKVVLFVGSHRFHGHEMREIGCRSYLREAAPELAIADTQASLEDMSLAREAVLDLLRRHPDLKGIYIAGGGMEGAIAALREEAEPGQVAVVCNELTEVSRAALADNIVSAAMSTPLAELSRQAVAQMVAALAQPAEAGPGQTFLPFDIFVSENI
ncbi:MAG: LacI family DNA-binding transcriptional regulator [Devosia nanyangense]|uniref:LacI family DNA-binding transcriptional regulator n=1 Tax=Devosia nanyangense TaxID=1228055 RepID=A0A933NZW3_9HYPH|nr:LacI family DNA-binding transcriptional regulator [Devosia nanyangense]